MGNSNSHGQGTIEVLIVLLALAFMVVAAIQFSIVNRNLIPSSQLSKEAR